jgi:hypothetical protein
VAEKLRYDRNTFKGTWQDVAKRHDSTFNVKRKILEVVKRCDFRVSSSSNRRSVGSEILRVLPWLKKKSLIARVLLFLIASCLFSTR